MSRRLGSLRRTSDGRVTVWSSGIDPRWLLAAVRAHEINLERGESLLKNEHKTSVSRIEHADRQAIVKHYRYMGARFFLKGLVRAHPGRRSVLAAHAFESRGFATPPVLGLVERTVCGLPAESWLVVEVSLGAVEMDRYILRNFAGGGANRSGDEAGSVAVSQRRRRFMAAFAATVDRLLGKGLCPRDFKACNVLVAEDGTSWRFLFIDLDDVRVQPEGARPSTRADWVRVLSQLDSTTPEAILWTDRLRFVTRLACEAFPRRELLTEVIETSRRLGRNYFSDDGPVERQL